VLRGPGRRADRCVRGQRRISTRMAGRCARNNLALIERDDRFAAVISGRSMTGFGRLLPADLLQTCRWGDFTRVGRPMVHSDTPVGLSVGFYNSVGRIQTNLPSAVAASTCGTISAPIPSAIT
jgi:hypothetical protein